MAACEGPTGPHLSGAAHLLADSNGDATTRVHGRACRGSYRHWRLGYLPPILRQPCVADMTGRSASGAFRTVSLGTWVNNGVGTGMIRLGRSMDIDESPSTLAAGPPPSGHWAPPSKASA